MSPPYKGFKASFQTGICSHETCDLWILKYSTQICDCLVTKGHNLTKILPCNSLHCVEKNVLFQNMEISSKKMIWIPGNMNAHSLQTPRIKYWQTVDSNNVRSWVPLLSQYTNIQRILYDGTFSKPHFSNSVFE